MDQPSRGWASLLTKDYLDARLEAFSVDFHREINRVIVWVVLTVIAGLVAAGGIVAAFG